VSDLGYGLSGFACPIVKRLLADEGLRKKVGAQERAEIMKNHTWFSRILSLLPEVERLKTGVK
jgi:hypothetical protein